MSDAKPQAQQRAELAAALGGITATVDGKTVTTTGHKTQPLTPAAYDAWPVWIATRPVTYCVDELDWQALVALPGSDPQTWVAMGDALVEAIADALDTYGAGVTRIEPVAILVAPEQSMPGLAFTLTI